MLRAKVIKGSPLSSFFHWLLNINLIIGGTGPPLSPFSVDLTDQRWGESCCLMYLDFASGGLINNKLPGVEGGEKCGVFWDHFLLFTFSCKASIKPWGYKSPSWSRHAAWPTLTFSLSALFGFILSTSSNCIPN